MNSFCLCSTYLHHPSRIPSQDTGSVNGPVSKILMTEERVFNEQPSKSSDSKLTVTQTLYLSTIRQRTMLVVKYPETFMTRIRNLVSAHLDASLSFLPVPFPTSFFKTLNARSMATSGNVVPSLLPTNSMQWFLSSPRTPVQSLLSCCRSGSIHARCQRKDPWSSHHSDLLR